MVASRRAGSLDQRRRRRCCSSVASVVARRAYVTGPGWTDELARIFDPRPTGPEWQGNLGYRGRKTIRLLLDGEDLVHAYAQAAYLQTGKWTGPLSAGVEDAMLYGAWRGGLPEEVTHPEQDPDTPQMQPPEILTFVAMPADLIEAVNPQSMCDGYPEEERKRIGRALFSGEGFFVNDFLSSLQEDNRLITWGRPTRLPGGAPRPHALLVQKHYQPGTPQPFQRLRTPPVILSQVMGAGLTLKIGDEVEAIKSGRLVDDKWLPSKWERAKVLAVNYDGTYDLQFFMNFGPWRSRRKEMPALKGPAMLSLRKNEVYRKYGSDSMPASFRMLQELNFAQAVPPTKIRQKGMLDRLSDTLDNEANQDWFLCSTRKFIMTSSTKDEDKVRLAEFVDKFQLGFRWVPTDSGLRFEPVPNATMAAALRVSHNDVAKQFQLSAEAEELARWKLDSYKAGIAKLSEEIKQIPELEPDQPRRPAGPLHEALQVEETKDVASSGRPRRSLAQELAFAAARR